MRVGSVNQAALRLSLSTIAIIHGVSIAFGQIRSGPLYGMERNKSVNQQPGDCPGQPYSRSSPRVLAGEYSINRARAICGEKYITIRH